MRKIYTSENKVKIYLLKSSLEQNGIQCFIKNENPPLAGEIPPVMAWPELWVMNDEDLPGAEKIIQSEIESDPKTKNKWTCPGCGELLEGQFEICWKCGSGVEK